MSPSHKKRVAVLISGNGSNLQALIEACKAQDYPAEIVLVISNIDGVYGLERAQKAGIPVLTFPHGNYKTRKDFETDIDTALKEHKVDLICLAGFMRILSPWFVEQWPNQILNIHPSLLPAFQGAHVQEQVLASGTRWSGCTVHFVVPEVDAGAIIEQACVPVMDTDTAATLQARIQPMEHQCYPIALRRIASGQYRIQGQRVIATDTA